jgi:hypothetical protein
MAGNILTILRRTPFDWQDVPQQAVTGATVLQTAVPVLAWKEISLLTRVHATTTGSAGSKITVLVTAVMPSAEDPSIFFGTGPIAQVDITTGTVAGTLVKLDISPQSSTPVNAGAFLAISVKATGATSGATDVTGTLSMALCVKD